MSQDRPKLVVPAVAMVLAYVLVGLLSASLADSATHTLSVWLAAGVVMGTLVVAESAAWPVLLGAAALAAWAWGMVGAGMSVTSAVAFALIEVGCAAAGAWVARRASAPVASMRGVSLFIGGAVLASLLGATLAAETWRWLLHHVEWGAEWRAWAFSTLLGMLLVVPVITAFKGFRVKRSGGMTARQFGAGAVAFLLFVIVAWIVFGPDVKQRFGTTAATLAYAPMPFLLIAAMLWGPRGGALAMLAGALLLIARTAAGGGPFAVEDDFAGEDIIEVQAFVALWAAMLLFARGLVEARRHAMEVAQDWRLRYERTLEATGVATVEFDAATGEATWGESAVWVLGPAVAGVRNIGDWLACVQGPDRAQAESSWAAVLRPGAKAVSHAYRVRLGGQDLMVQARLAAVRGPDGEVEEVAGILRVDVPEDEPVHV
jgi:integral membrane sensor domain MASE1